MRNIKGFCYRFVHKHTDRIFAIWNQRKLIPTRHEESHEKTVMRLLVAALLAAALLAGFLSASARPSDAFEIISHTPLANELDVELTNAITAVFSNTLNTSTVNTDTFGLRGDQTGPYDGVFSFPAGEELHFTPAQPFKPGETLYVTGSSGVLSTMGDSLKPYTWQFTGETGTALGVMQPHPVVPSFGTGTSTDVALGDLDGDGDLDALVAKSAFQAQTVWLNNGGGAFGPHPAAPTFGPGYSMAVALGDLDDDGDLDALMANLFGGSQTVWLNDGNGAFNPHPSAPSFGAGHSYALALGDLDGDGDLDVIVANYADQAQAVWLNDGGGVFSAHPAAPTFGAGDSLAVALGDLDGDGDLDALVANYADQAQTVWLNDGGGVFSAHPAAPMFGTGDSFDVALGDLDGDGDLDALVANDNDQAQTVWLNDGGGAFSAHPAVPSFGAGYSYDVALGDMDGDGDLDALVANDNDQAQTVWLNDGGGTFSAHPAVPSFGAGYSMAVALGDLDGDGDLDALVANSRDQAQTVWLNSNVSIYLPLVLR